MSAIDANRLFTDRNYRSLLYEYHSFVAYISNYLNDYSTIESSSVKFHKTSVLYDLKDEFIQMLKETFPLFNISCEQYGDHTELDEDEFSISVSWYKYKERS